ncbi:hypothetical protein L210DRAFT_3166763 [Boletus edulis BED1]|uniref:Uncharacterized protein n=1 Tax=Boletus edulis BED1 TaxID=1328754 RepID=A0AAD4BZ69_BOLED|nr:hypothetical protein L210DRAFT_3166763 [Boletus edulis BED1]
MTDTTCFSRGNKVKLRLVITRYTALESESWGWRAGTRVGLASTAECVTQTVRISIRERVVLWVFCSSQQEGRTFIPCLKVQLLLRPAPRGRCPPLQLWQRIQLFVIVLRRKSGLPQFQRVEPLSNMTQMSFANVPNKEFAFNRFLASFPPTGNLGTSPHAI